MNNNLLIARIATTQVARRRRRSEGIRFDRRTKFVSKDAVIQMLN